MFHPEDQERAWAAWRASLSTGEPYQIEYRLRHHSGTYRWVLGRALPIRDANGAIVSRWYGTCTDIHDAKMVQAEREVVWPMSSATDQEHLLGFERHHQPVRPRPAGARAPLPTNCAGGSMPWAGPMISSARTATRHARARRDDLLRPRPAAARTPIRANTAGRDPDGGRRCADRRFRRHPAGSHPPRIRHQCRQIWRAVGSRRPCAADRAIDQDVLHLVWKEEVPEPCRSSVEGRLRLAADLDQQPKASSAAAIAKSWEPDGLLRADIRLPLAALPAAAVLGGRGCRL